MAIAKKITKTNSNKKTKTGSRGKYKRWLEPEGLLLIESWARDGLTNDQIANNCGVARKTLQEWMVRFSDIRDTIKKGKEVIDIQVENALLKRALGYGYDEVKEEYENGHLVKKTVTTKKVVPDTTAQIFWLKNRRSDKWRNKEEIEVRNSEANEMLKNITEQMKKNQTKADIPNDVADLDGV